MKIVADKLDGKPDHGVTVAEVRALLRQLPIEWLESIQWVHLSASRKSWAIADFSSVSKRLTLCPRGKARDDVFRAAIRELHQHAALRHAPPEWRLSAKRKAALDAKLKKYLEALQPLAPTSATSPRTG